MHEKQLQFKQSVFYIDRSWNVNPKVVEGHFLCRDKNYPYTYSILDFIPYEEHATILTLKRDEFWTSEKKARDALASELRERICHAENDIRTMRERMEICLGKRKEDVDLY